MGTCMPTLSCLEAPPCILVLLTVCRRRSPLWLLPPSRSRLLLHQRGSTLSGSEDPSSPLSPPSSRCGSPSRSMMSPALQLSTENASKKFKLFFFTHLRQFVSPMHFSTNVEVLYLILNIVIVQLELN